MDQEWEEETVPVSAWRFEYRTGEDAAKRCPPPHGHLWGLSHVSSRLTGYSGVSGVLGPLSLNPSSTLLSTLTAKRQIAWTGSDHHPQHPHLTGPLKFVHLLAANPGVEVKVASSKVRMGSIPACAGEPPEVADRAEMRQVYPRVGGGTQHRLRFQKGLIYGFTRSLLQSPEHSAE